MTSILKETSEGGVGVCMDTQRERRRESENAMQLGCVCGACVCVLVRVFASVCVCFCPPCNEDRTETAETCPLPSSDLLCLL